MYLNLITQNFKLQFARSTVTNLASDGAAGKCYVKFPWLWPPHHVKKRRRKESTLSLAQLKLIYSLTKILVPVGSLKYSTLSDDGAFE